MFACNNKCFLGQVAHIEMIKQHKPSVSMQSITLLLILIIAVAGFRNARFVLFVQRLAHSALVCPLLQSSSHILCFEFRARVVSQPQSSHSCVLVHSFSVESLLCVSDAA